MQLFYSGAYAEGAVQPDPLLSLGKYPSVTPINNDSLNAVFPPIKRINLEKGLYDVRMIVLKNTSGTQRTGVKIWTVSGQYSTYYIAGVAPATDVNNNKVFEVIFSGNSLPYQATLAAHEGELNAIVAGTVAADAYVGIWIKREVNSSEFTEIDGKPSAPLTDEQLVALLQARLNQISLDEGSIVISWD